MLRLAELRKEKGITQKQLAEYFHVSSGNICDYEKGRIEPNISKIIAFADFFGVSTDYLLGRENDYGLVEVRNTNTPKENEVLSLFNALDEAHQVMMIDIMKKFADTTEKEKAF